MSQENVDVYFAAKDRLAAGDHEGFTRLIHPDVTATVANFPEPGPFLGRDALFRRRDHRGPRRLDRAHVSVEDRQVIEVHWRESRDEALEAAGLRE